MFSPNVAVRLWLTWTKTRLVPRRRADDVRIQWINKSIYGQDTIQVGTVSSITRAQNTLHPVSAAPEDFTKLQELLPTYSRLFGQAEVLRLQMKAESASAQAYYNHNFSKNFRQALQFWPRQYKHNDRLPSQITESGRLKNGQVWNGGPQPSFLLESYLECQ